MGFVLIKKRHVLGLGIKINVDYYLESHKDRSVRPGLVCAKEVMKCLFGGNSQAVCRKLGEDTKTRSAPKEMIM